MAAGCRRTLILLCLCLTGWWAVPAGAWTEKTAVEIMNAAAVRLPDGLRDAVARHPDQVRMGYASEDPWQGFDPGRPLADPRAHIIGAVIMDMNRFTVIISQGFDPADAARQYGVLARLVLALNGMEVLHGQYGYGNALETISRAAADFEAGSGDRRQQIAEPVMVRDPVRRIWLAYDRSLALAMEVRLAYSTGSGWARASRGMGALYDHAVMDLGDLAATAWVVAEQRLMGLFEVRGRIAEIRERIDAGRSSPPEAVPQVPGPAPPQAPAKPELAPPGG